MTVKDLVDYHLASWVSKVELLVYAAVPVNIHGYFLAHISLTSINLVGDHIPKVKDPIHPYMAVGYHTV